MNRYRVTLTVFSADSYEAEVEAMDEDHARRFAEQFADREYPDASEIRVDEVELRPATPETRTMIDRILTGHDAIDYAETHGLTLSKYSDPMEGAREMVEIPEAREIAADDPALIWIALP